MTSTRSAVRRREPEPRGDLHERRIYDPSLGRMLSADPYVQFPRYAQSFNRYSYVLNNPVRYTDPTGFQAAGWNESFVPMGYGMSGGHSGGRRAQRVELRECLSIA